MASSREDCLLHAGLKAEPRSLTSPADRRATRSGFGRQGKVADVTIRRIEAGDETEWRRLWTAYLRFYESSVSEEVYRSTFARLLADKGGAKEGIFGLLAEVDRKPVGLVHYIF